MIPKSMTPAPESDPPSRPARLDYDRGAARSGRALNGAGIGSCACAVIAAAICTASIHHAGKGAGSEALLFGVMLGFVSIVLSIRGLFRASNRERYSPIVGMFALVLAALPFWRLLQTERTSINHPPCANHLSQIGLAAIMYSNAHGGQLPPTLEGLVLSGDIAPEVLVCPESRDTPATGKGAALAASLKQPGHNSYTYLGAGRTAAELGSDVLLAYDLPANHGGQGVEALFGDGHVEFIPVTELHDLLAPKPAGTRPSTSP